MHYGVTSSTITKCAPIRHPAAVACWLQALFKTFGTNTLCNHPKCWSLSVPAPNQVLLKLLSVTTRMRSDRLLEAIIVKATAAMRRCVCAINALC